MKPGQIDLEFLGLKCLVLNFLDADAGLGHIGIGSGCQVDFFTDLGARTEEAAMKKDAGLIENLLKEFVDFMKTVEIVYEKMD